MVEINLPLVVILQDVEQRSAVKDKSANASNSYPLGNKYSFAFDLPVITSGSRCNQKTKGAEDVEFSKTWILGPRDRLELWGSVPMIRGKLLPGYEGWVLDIDHVDCSFASSYQVVTIVWQECVRDARGVKTRVQESECFVSWRSSWGLNKNIRAPVRTLPSPISTPHGIPASISNSIHMRLAGESVGIFVGPI